jgi:hypothetical protein
MPQVVIANWLTDGRIVFLAKDDQWAPLVNDARVSKSDEDAQAMLAAGEALAGEQQVVGPELIDVAVDGAEIRPTRNREAIRAAGPTNRLDLGKQAGN